VVVQVVDCDVEQARTEQGEGDVELGAPSRSGWERELPAAAKIASEPGSAVLPRYRRAFLRVRWWQVPTIR
jgi:hypothetical protein